MSGLIDEEIKKNAKEEDMSSETILFLILLNEKFDLQKNNTIVLLTSL